MAQQQTTTNAPAATGFRVQQAWSTPLYFATWDRHSQEAPGIIEHLYELKSKESKSIASGVAPGAKPLPGLFESKFDLFTSQHPGMRKLIAFVGSTLTSAIVHVNGGKLDAGRIRVSAVESWFHITNQGAFHDGHHHHNCSWCGIYYVRTGDNDEDSPPRNGCSRFYSPIAQGGTYFDFGNEYLRNGIYDITPEDGMLVLFPSYLLHSALPYKGKTDRIVIAFNSQASRK